MEIVFPEGKGPFWGAGAVVTSTNVLAVMQDMANLMARQAVALSSGRVVLPDWIYKPRQSRGGRRLKRRLQKKKVPLYTWKKQNGGICL